MNLVDSSGWLEYFADGPNAGHFAPPIKDASSLVVPTITLLEVFRRVRSQRDTELALEAAVIMRRGRVIDLDPDLAIEAAGLRTGKELPVAASIVLATAQRFQATIWTQDPDFEGIPGIEYRRYRTWGPMEE